MRGQGDVKGSAATQVKDRAPDGLWGSGAVLSASARRHTMESK